MVTETKLMTTLGNGYSGLAASTWDVWRADTSNWSDRAFYLEIIQQHGQPALELGCGTGRLVLDYLQQGIDIDGMDFSVEMLDICRAKAQKRGLSPNLYQQTMEALDLPRSYRTIIGSSSVFQLITDRDTARETLRRIFAHLQPGGVFVTPFGFDWREGEGMDSGWHLVFEKIRPEDGATVRRWAHGWCEPEKQWWHSEDRYEVELNGVIIAQENHRQSPELRWYTQSDAVQLYQEVGFSKIQLFRGFEANPASADDRLFCVLGLKPEVLSP
jgi:ubiquinone/menaquinone biosynthesis C-methylase UbiE